MMITNLYAIDEKAGNELRYLESLLDEHATSYGLDFLSVFAESSASVCITKPWKDSRLPSGN